MALAPDREAIKALEEALSTLLTDVTCLVSRVARECVWLSWPCR
jgi:hypothetical protein